MSIKYTVLSVLCGVAAIVNGLQAHPVIAFAFYAGSIFFTFISFGEDAN